MHWFQSLDIALFRFVNSTMQNSVFDWLMPVLSGNRLFAPLLILVAVLLLVKGSARVRVMLLMLAIIVPLGDSFVCNTIKHATLRLRPYVALENVHQLVTAGRDNSMPSSHSANWAAATMIVFLFFGRRSLWYMVPLGFAVSFSRIYNGVHYPSDVLAGWALGAGYAVAGVWLLNKLWQTVGKSLFPSWHARMPSLMSPEMRQGKHSTFNIQHSTSNQQWLALGYVFIVVLLVVRLGYLAAGVLDLSEDETYYWLWSKHPDLSYYSKPPLISYTIWLGTHLFGDSTFGVRFFSPVITAIMSFIVFRFMAREVNARAAFFLLLALLATPMLAVGSTLMTIDPLSVMFWTAAMLAGWRAVREDSTVRHWFWVGLWMGLGFLSKYTGLFQLLSWVVVFALIPAARKQLKRPGPWVALVVLALCATPVLLWNQQHDWITVRHVSDDAHAGDAWKFTLHEFLVNEALLLNPVFFVMAVWAAVAFWKRKDEAALTVQNPSPQPSPRFGGERGLGLGDNQAQGMGRMHQLRVYLFAMGAPIFLVYMLWSFHSRIMPNWIAPSVLPFFCLAVTFWDGRVKSCWLTGGLIVGLLAVGLMHHPALLQSLIGRPLPKEIGRTVGWRTGGDIIRAAKHKLEGENRPVFLIGGHYGVASQMAFQLRDEHVDSYCLTAKVPKNQFYFWPGYTERKGDNAIYFQVLGGTNSLPEPPAQLMEEFASVSAAGVFPVNYFGQPLRYLQVFECRGVK